VIKEEIERPQLDQSHVDLDMMNLEYIQGELARIDLRIHRSIQLWKLAGQNPADDLRGLYISDQEAEDLITRPFASNWGATAHLPQDSERWFREQELKLAQQQRILLERFNQQKIIPRLKILEKNFGLSPFEVDSFLVCLAPSLDTKYERWFGYLQDDVTRKRPSINLILDLLCAPGAERLVKMSHFTNTAPLIQYRLLSATTDAPQVATSLLTRSFQVDQSVIMWLLGQYTPDPDKLPGASYDPDFERSDSADLIEPQVEAFLEQAIALDAVLIFTGVDENNQDQAAHFFSQRLRKPLLTFDLRHAVAQEVSSIDGIYHALRDARLTDSILYLKGWDIVLLSEENERLNLENLFAHPGSLILAGKKFWQAEGFQRERKSIWIDFPVPDYLARKKGWDHYLSPYLVDSDLDVSYLAGQFQLTSGKIRDAVQTAADKAFSQKRPIGMDDLFKAARLHSNPRLVNLAHKIEPRYSWDDIILPADQIMLLKEISATVRGRPKVLDEWGVGKKLASSRGVTVLFAGPPGTGKTMAAEVIALELHLDLYKIDLSTIVSKYIGETEKNLERIFSEAESSSAILFFDEADSLFGKRSEVRDSHDRYANIEISYLLQRMEAYDGVTILATNLRSNLDEAFTRRLQFAVDFPFPEAPDRLRIWRTLFPTGVPRAPDINFELLSKRFRLAGGNIRNIIVSAAYLAASDGGVVEMAHLLHGTRRELQKMGRLVSDMDFSITPPQQEE